MGLALGIYQYFFNRSVWLDEASLARNLIYHDFLELLKPLDFHQVAPIGFLYLEKLFVVIFGQGELAMRLFPLLSYIMATLLLYLVGTKLTGQKVIGLLAASLFALNPTAIYFASEIKQYMTDCMVILFVFYTSLSLDFSQKKSTWQYALFGVLAILFSNVSIIGLFVGGLYVLYNQVILRKNYQPIAAVAIWMLAFGLYYLFFIHDHPSTQYMVDFWRESFMPLNPASGEFWHFLHEVVYLLYKNLLNVKGLGMPAIVLTALTIVTCIVQRKLIYLYFILSPIAVHLLLSGFHLYPYFTRLILYQLPLILLLVSIGAFTIFSWINKKIALPVFLLILPCLLTLKTINRVFPIQKHEIKKSIEYLDAHIQEDDYVFVYYISMNAFTYYKDIGFVKNNNPTERSIHFRNFKKEYRDQLRTLKGRNWLIFSQVFTDSENKTINFLRKEMNAKILDKQSYFGSTVYLLDIP